jgi:hypothetical protein
VFPPNNQPGVKMGLLPEVSWDGEHWHELHFKYAPNHERSLPHFVAPYHPRGDQAIIYDTFGLNANSLMGGLLGPWDPYFYATSAPALEFCQKLVESKTNHLAQSDEMAQHATPPRAARITTVMLEPTTLAERRATGKLWHRTYVGPHVPSHQFDPHFYEDAYGEPELWHPESIVWRSRSRLRELMERSRAGKEDPQALALWDGQLTAADVALFWNEFVPLISAADRGSFEGVPELVRAVRAKFDRKQRRILARLAGRFTLILLARFEPLYFYRGARPLLAAPSYLHLWMLAQHILSQGKAHYLACHSDQARWSTELSAMTTWSGLYLNSVLRFEEMCFEAQKLRLLESVGFPHDPEEKRAIAAKHRTQDPSLLTGSDRLIVSLARTFSGFFCVMVDVRESFIGPAFNQGFPELYPSYEELPSGDIRVKSYAHPEPNQPLAPDLKSLRL